MTTALLVALSMLAGYVYGVQVGIESEHRRRCREITEEAQREADAKVRAAIEEVQKNWRECLGRPRWTVAETEELMAEWRTLSEANRTWFASAAAVLRFQCRVYEAAKTELPEDGE